MCIKNETLARGEGRVNGRRAPIVTVWVVTHLRLSQLHPVHGRLQSGRFRSFAPVEAQQELCGCECLLKTFAVR